MTDPLPPPRAATDTHDFAPYVRILGRGPGKSRALTRAEAHHALTLILQRAATPEQIGAFLMLLRYRGEAVEEMAGLVEAARDHADLPWRFPGGADLDWPSYADGRTRGLPWYLLSALLLAHSGRRVLMHGPLAGPGRQALVESLHALGITPACSAAEAEAALAHTHFAFVPTEALSPGLAHLLALRGTLGLRSPMNTVGRLLDPADASGSVDGVFHPNYIALHIGTAALLGRQVTVLKGGGGEAEWTGAKPLTLTTGCGETVWPALPDAGRTERTAAADLAALWAGQSADPAAETVVIATAAVALHACHPALAPGDAIAQARALWSGRPT